MGTGLPVGVGGFEGGFFVESRGLVGVVRRG